MNPAGIVSIIVPRIDTGLLVSLDDLKLELQIANTDNDDYLSKLLARVSGEVERYCNRVFAVETVQETFRLVGRHFHTEQRFATESLQLKRDPVISIASVTADSALLDPGDYEIDPDSDEVYRLSGDLRTAWCEARVDVVYVAGYETTPGPVQQAIFDLVKLFQAARTRDPSLQSENILEGLYSYRLFAPSEMVDGMPMQIAAVLDGYKHLSRA